jgi:hypothetical protein
MATDSTEPTSLDRAKRALQIAASQIEIAARELEQLDRCPHNDYPYGTPSLKRCVLKEGHVLPHLYPELGWMDGGKTMNDLSVEDQLRIMRGETT